MWQHKIYHNLVRSHLASSVRNRFKREHEKGLELYTTDMQTNNGRKLCRLKKKPNIVEIDKIHHKI